MVVALNKYYEDDTFESIQYFSLNQILIWGYSFEQRPYSQECNDLNIALSYNGDNMIYSCHYSELYFFDTADSKPLWRGSYYPFTSFLYSGSTLWNEVAISEDGRFIASCHDERLVIYDDSKPRPALIVTNVPTEGQLSLSNWNPLEGDNI